MVDTDTRISGHATWRHTLGASLGLVTLLTLLLAAFAWPTSEAEPRDLPIAVVSPAGAAGIEAQLAGHFGADAFEVTALPDREAAVAAIRDREVYGALVVGPAGPEVLTASAAGPAPAQLLTRIGSQIAASSGTQPTVTDVAPNAEGDPDGRVFASGALPLALGGIIIGAVTSLALRRTRERVTAALLTATGGGLTLAAVLQGWLDALAGNYWANASVITLGILAVALPIVGLRHHIGPAGIGVMALLVMLIGNPLSGVTTSPDLLPFGWVGQLFPPGAVGSALRGTSYFEGAGALVPLVVLTCWAMIGLTLTVVPRNEGNQETRT